MAIGIDRLCSRSGGGKLSGPLLGHGQRAKAWWVETYLVCFGVRVANMRCWLSIGGLPHDPGWLNSKV